MDITKFFNRKSGEENQIARFEKMLPECKSKKDIRNLETHLLKPKPIPTYKGVRPGKTNFQKRTILFYFPSKSFIDRFSKFFTVNQYIQNNTYDIEFLVELVRLMEKKRIRWNRHLKRFVLTDKDGNKIKL